MPDFIPRQDAAAVVWGANFSQHVAAEASRFRLSGEIVAELARRQADFADAVRVAKEPGTRTSISIVAKDAARRGFEQLARPIAGQVRAIAAEDRTTLILFGLATGPGRQAPRRRVRRPTSVPRASIRDVDGSRVTIQLQNTDTPSRRGMDPDIAMAHVYAFFGEQYPASLSAWKHYGVTSRAIKTIDLGPAHRPGAQVWITAQWSNRRGETGAQATPVMTFLGYCGATRAAIVA